MSFASGLLVGILLGSLLGLLLAPSSGAETRRQLAESRERERAKDEDDGLLGLPRALIGAVVHRLAAAKSGADGAVAEEKARLTAEWLRRRRGA